MVLWTWAEGGGVPFVWDVSALCWPGDVWVAGGFGACSYGVDGGGHGEVYSRGDVVGMRMVRWPQAWWRAFIGVMRTWFFQGWGEDNGSWRDCCSFSLTVAPLAAPSGSSGTWPVPLADSAAPKYGDQFRIEC